MATAAYVFQNAELILISVGMILILGVCIAAVTAARFLKKRKTIGCKFVTGGEDPPLTLEACQEAFLKLAAQHTRTKARYCGYLMKSLTHLNYLRLHKVRRLLSETSSEIIELVPSARWLLGNYYDLHLGIKKIQSEIPRKIRLPVITEGSDKGLPRICAISCQLILKLGTRLSEENVTKMLKAYQKATPLTSEELWILQQALNLHLVENILSISGDIFKSINTKKTANDFVNARLQQISNTGDILRVLNMTEQLSYNNDVTFCSHVLYRLKNISLDETVLNKWASAVCPGLFEDPTPARIIAEERSNEAHLESMTRMLFTCLRLIKSFAYSDLFEAASPIEQILRHDPAGVYPMMNAKTRMRYRTELEKIARRRRLFQWELAEKILGLASAPAQKDLPHANHVGTYLIGQGRPLLISMLRGQRGPVKKQTTRSKNRTWLYFTFIAGLFGLFEYVLIKNLTLAGYELFGWVMFFFFCITVPLISGIAIELTNFLLTSLLPPKNLPGLDFLDGLPDEFRTLVVLPVLLGNPEQAVEYAQRLEKHYLANPQKNLFYAILGDFTDAPERCMPKDDSIVRAASQAIDQLNNKYFPQSPRFTVLMRYRRWNESEECWMGWERKRGKLEELNALLCGDTSTSYAVIAGNTNLAGRFKYVITLDGDTDLVRDCAAKLVGAAAHPLNQPIFDPNTNRITDGYAIIQPEVHNHLFSKDRSRLARVFACDYGLDTYSVNTSDVYQDLCSEGIFVGKGIYDVAVVHRMLHKTFSENSVLSHDLIESCYVRCAFQSETVLLDNYPSSIEAYMRREHRWIRGDWQLLPWLFKKAPISRLSRWKITDNLRRSICPVCELALIFFCTVFVPQFVFMWVPIVLFRFSLVLTIRIVKTILSKIFCPQCRVLLVLFGAALLENIMQMMSSFILIPYRAWVAADAILRTLFRLIISHKKLLQWQASEAVEKVLSKTLFGYIRKMLPASCLGLALLTVVYFSPLQLGAKIALSLIALLWMLSPPAAYAMSRAVGSPQEKDQSGTDEEKTLRLHARRIWQYTVDFATAENNWLNPDNYQSYPVGKVANRTSPTNIGLQFLSLLTARDFGYIGLTDFVEACERLLSTVQALPKWNGHLYNWYNTNTLEVLNPGYVSTVDSGNFLCYALTLKNGLRELKNMPFDLNTAVKGINDTLALAGCELSLPETIASADAFYTAVRAVREQISAQGNNPWEDRFWIDALMHTCDSVLRDEFEYTGSGSRATTLPTVCETGIPVTGELADRIDRLIGILEELVRLTNFGMLYDQKQQLLYIGYRAYAQMPDDSHYDLAASEAIQTSFLAIAKGDIPLRHWKHLGRPLTLVHGLPAFVSWSGTMFEYLMPGLIMNYHRDSTFAQSMVAAVRHQIDFSKKAKIPWGISESQYFCFDTQSNYQYKAFGIPRLRMEPGSDSGKVVSPYSTFLALPYAFRKAMRNLKRMESLGALGRYGLYEAIDYDSPDTDALKKYSVIKSFMAHHLGMSLAAINNRLNQNILRKRFHREPMIGAAESLLEEKRRSYVVTLARHGYSVDTKQSELDEQRQELRMSTGQTCSIPVSIGFPMATIPCSSHRMETASASAVTKCSTVGGQICRQATAATSTSKTHRQVSFGAQRISPHAPFRICIG
jgi:hypothetical protein